MNYQKLMSHEPTIYGEFTNSLGQLITFVEHPFKGDEFPVICVCHELQLAAASDFFELDDMTADHGEYAPSFQENKLFIGEFEAEG
jgi:hypothetical protein